MQVRYHRVIPFMANDNMADDEKHRSSSTTPTPHHKQENRELRENKVENKEDVPICSICWNPLTDDPVLTLNCSEMDKKAQNHTFHFHCIFRWSNGRKNHNNPHTGDPDPQKMACPYCKTEFKGYIQPRDPFVISRVDAIAYVKLNGALLELDKSNIFGDTGFDYDLAVFGELPVPDFKIGEKTLPKLKTIIDTTTTKLNSARQKFNTGKQQLRIIKKKMVTSARDTARLRHQLRVYQEKQKEIERRRNAE